jgi:rhodanese-related sulfurtransferase
MTDRVSPAEAKKRLHAGHEIAFLDVREAGQFGEGHPLFAVPCPYSRLELDVESLVPNRRVPMLLIDAGNGVAERAAWRLAVLGYDDVSVVVGGARGWAAAGLTLYKGVNVPSKTLGELAEAVWHPRLIDAAALNGWRNEGRPFRVFDARPPAEYYQMRIPGASCLPNGELAHRFSAAIDDPEVPVVINCAGRTRSITGAIGLGLLGVTNRVFALENGTQGWTLAGLQLERGATAEPYPELGEEARHDSRNRALRLAEERQIAWIDADELAGLRADAGRTLYIFDVRSREEYEAAHFPGAVHAPGGQLVQASDQWIGVRHARVVLADDTGMRATIAAFWLRQLGFEVYVLPGAASPPSLRGRFREEGRSEPQNSRTAADLPLIAANEAAAGSGGGEVAILDIRSSQAHRTGHPVGARWTTRALLGHPPSLPAPARGKGDRAPTIALLAEDRAVAALAANDMRELGFSDIRLLDGGLQGWIEAGLPVESTADRPTDEGAIDFLRFVHDRHDGNLESARRYLEWEQGLVAQLDSPERAEFRLEQPLQR